MVNRQQSMLLATGAFATTALIILAISLFAVLQTPQVNTPVQSTFSGQTTFGSSGSPLLLDLPPQVVNVNSLIDSGDGTLAEGETTANQITKFFVTFSEAVVGADDVANYTLIADPDGAATVIAFHKAEYDEATLTVRLSLTGGPIGPGDYRLIVSSALTDADGNPLDGDADTVGGDDFVLNFTIGDETVPPQVVSVGSVAPTADGVLDEGESTNVSITQLTVTFSEDVQENGKHAAQKLDNYLLTFDPGGANTPITIDAATYDATTDVVTLDINGGAPLADGNYALTVMAFIEDYAGNPLDGNNDGAGGDDFTRHFSVGSIPDALDVSLAVVPASVQMLTPTVELQVYVEDEYASAVTGLGESAFTWTALPGGLTAADVSNFADAGGGNYTFDLAVASLSPNGNYTVTVLVDDGSATDSASASFAVTVVYNLHEVYVDDSNLVGPWDGTQEHPFRTITDAIQFLYDNGYTNSTIHVAAGLYIEQVIVTVNYVFISGTDGSAATTICSEVNPVLSAAPGVKGMTFGGFTLQSGACT